MAALPDWNVRIHTQHDSTDSVASIVVPLGGGEDSEAVVTVVRRLSDLYGARVHVLYIDSSGSAAEQRFGVQELSGAVFERAGADVAETISRLEHDLRSALIVLSTACGAAGDADRFGSLTESVLARRPERVVMVRPNGVQKPWTLRRVLLAHDGTPASHAATGPAADVARRAGAEVIALHVAARGEERPGEPGSMPAPLYVDQPQHEWPAWAGEFMNRLLAAGAPPSNIHFKLAVTSGQPGSEVADVARERDMDLVVMAWHGHWEPTNSATRVVIRNSVCPVMLIYSAD